MDCFDCSVPRQAGTVIPRPPNALAVCARCGAGICGKHLHVTADPLPGPPDSSVSLPEARRLTCGVCYEAEGAAPGAWLSIGALT